MTISSLRTYLCVLMIHVWINQANAQAINDAVQSQADRLIQEQQLKREQIEREREAQRQQTLPNDFTSKFVIPEANDVQTCSQVNTIVLKGAKQISQKQQQQLTSPYQNRCLGLKHINQLLAVITNVYFEQGYVTSRAYIAPQNMSSGILTIIVIEGKITALLSEQLKQRMIKQALPSQVGQTLNLRDLEQGIDQLNRLPSGQASLKLIPGEKPGESNVQFNYQKNSRRWRLALSADNSGQESSGEEQLGINAALDNPLGFADIISLNAQTAIDAPTGSDTQNISLHYDIPLGYWNLDIDLSSFEYQSRIAANNVNTSGDSDNQHIKLARLWYRDQVAKFGNRLSLKRKDNQSFVADTLLPGNSRTIASASLESWFQRNIKQGSWSATFIVDQGIDAFGAENDDNDSGNPGDTQAEFNKVRLNASYYKRLGALNYSANLNSQYTRDILNGADQISIGSQYTVRGFKQQGVSGNKGYYIRQELSRLLPVSGWLQNHTGQWQLALGLDWGKVRDLSPLRSRYTELSGYGLKLRNSGKALNISIELAKALNQPDSIETDNIDIYISLNYRYSGKA